MQCPNCSNEISPGESFCGQCGTPNISQARPASPLNANTAPSRSGLLSGGYNTALPAAPNAHALNSGMLPPQPPQLSPDIYNAGRSPAPAGPSGPQQQPGFYHEATEAISALPGHNGYPVQNYQMGYPQQQGFVSTPMPGGYAGVGQFSSPMQPSQSGNYAGSAYPQSQPFLPGQGYGVPGGMPPAPVPPPQKRRSNLVLVIACFCLAFAIITVAAFGALYLLHGNSPSKTQTKTNAAPTTAPTATQAPSATQTLNPSPTATSAPSPTPSVTITVTPPADQGFSWCAPPCSSYGFIVEYPNGWQQSTTQDPNGFGGVQFSAASTNNPSQQDEIATFKSSGVTTQSSTNLVDSDLSVNFSMLPGYQAPTSPADVWIDGAKWTNETASYQLNNQTEHVEVYATVNEQRSYIIELQAPQSLFIQVNNQYFENMLGRFQFQESTS